MSSPVLEYIGKQPQPQQDLLNQLRDYLISQFPQAEECLSYGVPALKLNKHTFLYAAFKKHLGIYPGPQVIENFQTSLKNYKLSKGTIQIPLDQPLPLMLISKLINATFKLD